MNEIEAKPNRKKKGRKKNPIPIKIISLIFAFFMVGLPIAAYIMFEEDIVDGLAGSEAIYFQVGIPLVIGICGLFATYFFYLGFRKMRIVRNKKDNSMLFKITSVAGIAGGIALGIITILYFLEDIIDWEDSFPSLGMMKVTLGIVLFALMSPVLIYYGWGLLRKRKTRRAVIFSAMTACMLVGSSIFLGLYQDLRMASTIRGPYLSWSEDPRTTMSFAWESPDPAPKKLEWSTSIGFSSFNELEATEWDYRAQIERYHYNVTLRNLEPGTTYYYRVPGLHDEITPFTTAPNVTEAFRLFAYGDSREANMLDENQHVKLVGQMQTLASQAMPALIINSGDIANDWDDTVSWDAHFGAIKPLASKVPYFTGTGNHEWNEGMSDQENYHTLIHECPSSGPLQINETSYAFKYSNAFFIFLGLPHAASWNHAGDDTVLNWLNDTLTVANQTSDWIFLAWHVPPFTATEGRPENQNLQDNICPYLHEFGVDVVFLGHDHNLQFQNITSANNNTGWNVTYIITGGGGASLYDIEDPDKEWTGPVYSGDTLYARRTYEFLCVDVDNTTATITAYDDGGDMLYQMTRNK